MSWANSLYLALLIIPLVLIWFFWWSDRRAKNQLNRLVREGLCAKVVDLSVRQTRKKRAILRISALVFLIIAISGPRWGYEWQRVDYRGLEIVFVVDVSKSMLATDIKPSRLERAKLAMKDLLGELHSDKVGLVAFSGSAFLQCPLTPDYSAFAMAIDALNTQLIPRGGTAIGEALKVARTAFKSGSSGSKNVILITDGENHEGDPLGVAREAAGEGITIHTVGIGSPSGELIITRDAAGNTAYLKDEAGNPVKTALNERILKEIAQVTKGSYLRAGGVSLGLDQLYFSKLAGLTKQELSSKLQKRMVNRFQIPLLLALICLVWEFFMGMQVKLKLGRMGLN